MAREQLVPRCYGSETEYGYRLPRGRTKTTTLGHLVPPDTPHVGQFLQNGARLYQDCGFIEYATPACPTLEGLINHELAGEELVWAAYGDGRSEIVSLHKRCSAPNSNEPSSESMHYLAKDSSGAHENYSTRINVWEGDGRAQQIASLAAHFATRTIYTGAGQPTDRGYLIGQKIQHLTDESGCGSTNHKALVNTRNEPHTLGGLHLRRLHVVCGDANVSPWAIRMKYGTTSLVLRLMEHDLLDKDIFLKHPLQSAKRVASGIDGVNEPLLLRTGKTATALNIQETLAEMARTLSQNVELPEEEKSVLYDWQLTIDALRQYVARGELSPVLQQIDWQKKKEIIDVYKDKKGGITRQREEAIDLLYDMIPNGLGARLRRDGLVFSTHAPSREKIEAAKTTAPPGRPRLLGELIRTADKREHNIYAANWQTFYTTYGPKREVSLGPVEVQYTDEQVSEIVQDFFGNLPD